MRYIEQFIQRYGGLRTPIRLLLQQSLQALIHFCRLVDVWHTELWIVVGAKTNELQHKFEVNIVAVLQFQLKMITDDGNSAFAAATSHIHRS